MQSKLSSLSEAAVNVLIGYVINLVVQLLIYPAYGATFTLGENIQIGVVFTVVSLARSYVIRRWFNKYIVRLTHGTK